MGWSSDGKEGGSDGKEGCKDSGKDGAFSAELDIFMFDIQNDSPFVF